jgi:hypothetical protein
VITEEVIQEKTKLEGNIRQLIMDFRSKTGFLVTSIVPEIIEVSQLGIYGTEHERHYGFVKTRIEL